jgi:benzoyl-CoA 2,3-dioxygenase component B
MSLYERIPNNVDLSNDKRLLRALEHWLPNYMQWWGDMGPEGFQADDVYLRTATSVEPGGWAHFDYVKMPDYRWGIFLAPPEHDRRVGFGDHMGLPVWQEVPGEYRNMLRRLIVTQGDTEPASVEQQRLLGQSAPSLYDLRNLFQVNVEEGRHLWAMVYLLHSYFGRDGREESEELLERRSGSSDKPRILEAFNEPIEDWLSFYMFTTFTDRDGKYQLLALAESGFDPLSRTTRFMLTEEAHHMFVGESGVRRVVRRACELMRETGDDDVRRQGVSICRRAEVHQPVVQPEPGSVRRRGLQQRRHFLRRGMKGRAQEPKYTDHLALEGSYRGRGRGDSAAQCHERGAARRIYRGLRKVPGSLEPRDYRARDSVPAEPARPALPSAHRRVRGASLRSGGPSPDPGAMERAARRIPAWPERLRLCAESVCR